MESVFNSLIMMLGEMAPYILLGFLIAGLLQEFVPQRFMSHHLAKPGWQSVVKAALVGIPLPLCSCGVLPTAVALKRNGASKAATTSFLIATPQTGVDSIAATWSLLGPAFAVIRPVASLITALIGGCLVGWREKKESPDTDTPHIDCAETAGPTKPLMIRTAHALKYGFYNMVQSIGGWLVAGLVIAALITVFVPDDFFLAARRFPVLSMIAVVIVAIPMYVCATGSIPIALSLMLKGLGPGAAFVLLMAGPAANFASATVVSKALGRRSMIIYLAVITVSSIIFGCIIDCLLPSEWFLGHLAAAGGHSHCHLSWFEWTCGGIMAALLAIALLPRLWKRFFNRNNNMKQDMAHIYKILGMECAHCQATVKKGLEALPGVKSVDIDLAKKTARVEGDADAEVIRKTIESLGFDWGGPCEA